MKKIKILASVLIVMGMVFPVNGGAADYSNWEDVLSTNDTVSVYVEKMKNNTGNPKISEERSTEVVKNMFEKRISPKFNVVNSKEKADVIFKGDVEEYIWMEKAPITDIYGAGALAMDLATRGGKNYARKIIKYTIYSASDEKVLRDGVTLVTIKKPGMPEEKSYDMMYERSGKMLARNVFRKGKRDSLRP